MTLLNAVPFLLYPRSTAGWAWAGVLSFLLLYFLWRWRKYTVRMDGRRWLAATVLLLLVPLTAFFGGVPVHLGIELPPPDLPADPILPMLMVFSAVPWFFAARLLGPPWAVLLGGLTGAVLGYWNTHSLFTPLETALLAAILSAALRQPYRTLGYRILRNPLGAAVFASAFFFPLFLIDQTLNFSREGSYNTLVAGLDYAATLLPAHAAAICGPILAAALGALALRRINPGLWGRETGNKPSPMETSLEKRFLYTVGPMYALLILSVLAGVWMIVSGVSQQMLLDRLESTARVTADGVPFFLKTGENMMRQFALDERFLGVTEGAPQPPPSGMVGVILQEKMNLLPFFDELAYIDSSGNVVASTFRREGAFNLTTEETDALRQALNGVAVQSYAIPAESEEKSARMSFLAAVQDRQKRVHGILLGRSELASNPLLEPVFRGLNALSQIGGVGYLLDENNRILYQSSENGRLAVFPADGAPVSAGMVEKGGEDGVRRIYFSLPVSGRGWTIVLSVPAAYPQNIALRMVMAIFGVIILAAMLTWRAMQYIVQKVTKSLKAFAVQADRIARGELEASAIAAATEESNEIGELGRSIEKMRLRLKIRLDELNRLLIVSQHVASTLDIENVIQPILSSALGSGADAARVVLSQFSPYDAQADETGGLTSFGEGPSSEQYGYLDEQIYSMTRNQDLVLLTNVPRASLLRFSCPPGGGTVCPQALVAAALRHENTYLGTFWVAFDQPHALDAEDEFVRFITTLASQMAVAAANSRLYLTSELGRQRLSAILEATPDPVLVMDENGRLLLANPAARVVLGERISALPGPAEDTALAPGQLSEIVQQQDLARLVLQCREGTISGEITMPDGRVFLATVSAISVDGRMNGRVCVMQDVTRFKELDTMKSDFVSTVSHDLRSPLTLIHGYVTMLEMVGDLNEQQTSYVRRISASIDKMGHLINNLLDLGRIESGVPLQLETIKAGEIAEQVMNAFQMPAQQKQLRFSSGTGGKAQDTLIEVDISLIQQALHNLVDNAIKYTGPSGEVRLEIDLRGAEVVFAVVDTGIGIAPVDQAHLFEKFFRAGAHAAPGGERTVEGGGRRQGSGLGLAIVKSIAERHRGRVWMESRLGKGSTFFFAVPLRQIEQGHPEGAKNQ